MKFTPELKQAIKAYYDAKYKDGDGYFRDSGLKERVIEDIFRAARPLGLSTTVVPGTIYFKNNTELVEVNRRNWWIGKKVK